MSKNIRITSRKMENRCSNRRISIIYKNGGVRIIYQTAYQVNINIYIKRSCIVKKKRRLRRLDNAYEKNTERNRGKKLKSKGITYGQISGMKMQNGSFYHGKARHKGEEEKEDKDKICIYAKSKGIQRGREP